MTEKMHHFTEYVEPRSEVAPGESPFVATGDAQRAERLQAEMREAHEPQQVTGSESEADLAQAASRKVA